MSGYNLPNTTQVPDAFFDTIHDMKESELKVTLYLIRQTFGWRREWTKGEFTKGAVITKKAGLSPAGARNGIEAGMRRGTIERKPDPDLPANRRGFLYRIRVAKMKAADPQIPDPQNLDPYEVAPTDPQNLDPKGALSVLSLTPTGNTHNVNGIAPNDPAPQPTRRRKPSGATVKRDELAEEIARDLTGRPDIQTRDRALLWPVVSDIRGWVSGDTDASLTVWWMFRAARETEGRWDGPYGVKPHNLRNEIGKWSVNGGAATIRAILAERAVTAANVPRETPAASEAPA